MHWSYEKQKTKASLSRCLIWEHRQAQRRSHSGAVSEASNMPLWKWDCKPFLAPKGTFALSVINITSSGFGGSWWQNNDFAESLERGRNMCLFWQEPKVNEKKERWTEAGDLSSDRCDPLSRPPASPNRVSLLILPPYGHCYSCWNGEIKTG